MPTGLGDEKLWLCPSLDNVTPFNDLSIQGNNGTAQGGLSTVADTGSGGAYCYDFDGVDDYIQTALSDTSWRPTSTSDFTISGWYKTGNKFGYCSVLDDGAVSLAQQSNLNVAKALGLAPDADASFVATPYPNSGFVWRHFLMIVEGGSIRAYEGGVLQTTVPAGSSVLVNAQSYDARVGTNPNSGAPYSAARMDDIRAYNRVLTQSEITHLATARGIEGRPFDGLGDEQLWLCPSLENSPNDISGNNNNGAYNGGMGTIADTSNGGSLAYDLNGTTQYITLGSVLTGTGDFTISGWFNTDSTSYSYIYGKDVSSPTSDGIGIAQQANTVYGAIGDSSGRAVLAAAGTTAISTWYHYAVTFDRDGVATKYLNGVQIGTDSISSRSGDIGTDTDYVGRFGNVSGGFFDGKLDDIRAYNRVLTQAEISWLATERGVLGTPPEGLGDEQLWLCPSIQDSANDISGNNNNGAYQGGMGTVTSDGKLCYDFDGTNDYIDIQGLTGQYTTGGSHSTSIWIYQDTVQNQQYFTRYQSGANDERSEYFYAEATNSATKAGFKSNTASYIATASGTNQSGVWYNIVTTYDHTTNTQTIYKNGVSVGSSVFPSDSSWSTNYAEVGRASISGGSVQVYSDCKMDDIRSFTRALTQDEISWLATERGVLGTPPEGLGDEQLWLCPSIQDSPNDISGNGNNGVYQGGMGTVADTGSGGSRAYDTSSAGDLVKCVYQGTDSISGWFYISSANRGASTSMFTGTDVYSGGDWGDGLYWDNTTIYVKKNNTIGGWVNLPSGSVPAGAWFHYASVRTASGMSYYVDGVEVQTANTSTTDRGDFFIGNATGTSPQGDFRSDDIRAYTRALTQSEITHLASQRGVLGTPIVGLGDEQNWYCPSLSEVSDITSNGTFNLNTSSIVSDTSNGGSKALSCVNTSSTLTVVGDPYGGIADASYSFWVNTNAQSTDWVQAGSSSRRNPWVGGNPTYTYFYHGSGNYSEINTPSTGAWNHYAFVKTGASQSVYINGVLDTTDASPALTYTNASYVVNFGANNSDLKLDDYRGYTRALTQSEITHLASQRGVLGSPATTTQYNAFLTHAFRQLFQTRLR